MRIYLKNMKKLFTLLALIVISTITAQAPQGFNYQATVRNSSGALIINQNVYFKFNIMLNSQTSVPVYTETHYVPTDDLGQVNLTIGSGTPTTGTFAGINWASGTYYLGIELSTTNATSYVAMGTTQLLSVPYALYANSAGSSQSQGKTSIYLTGDITNAEAAAKIAAELGPETENIYIRNTTQLTTVDLSTMVNATDIRVSGNAVLTNVDLSGLINVYERFYFDRNPTLNTLLVQSLTNAYEFQVNNVTTLNLSSLTQCNYLYVENIVNFIPPSNIESCSFIGIFSMPNLNTLSFPSLVSCSSIDVVASISISNNLQLTSISFPVLESCSNVFITENALTSTNINSLLNKFLTVSPTVAKTIQLIGQTPPAPPTGQGLIDKQTLIDAGNSVLTD
jgi:hypothetical protein